MSWPLGLGITALVLLLLAILPLGAMVRYNADGLLVQLIVGPVRLQVYPGKKKEAKKDKKEKPAKADKKTAPAPKEKEKGGSLADFMPFVRIALDFLNEFRQKLRIDRLEVKLILANQDPAALAVSYGRAWAALGAFWPQLERCFVIKKRNVEVECDFTATNTLVIARADITITLGRLLGLLVCYGIRLLKAYLKMKKSKEGGATK